MKRQRLKGLVIHHRRHPLAHPRRLVRRVRSREGRPGRCDGKHASSIQLTCLVAYCVASDQKPGMQLTMCEGCAGPVDDLAYRLVMNVARALRPRTLRRAFTLDNLQWLYQQCHRRETKLDHCLARYLKVWRLNCTWAETFPTLNCSPDADEHALSLLDVPTAG